MFQGWEFIPEKGWEMILELRSRRPISPRTLQSESAKRVVAEAFKESGERYGSPRLQQLLKRKNIKLSRNTVAKHMASQELFARRRRAFRNTTNSSHKKPIAENVLKRDFSASSPNEKWVSDVTYIRTRQGWMYLCVVLDLYSRKIVGWELSESLETPLVSNALANALRCTGLHVARQLIFHSDRGVQYASEDFRKLLNEYQLIQSMSRKGDCWDNSVVESFFNSLKIEEIYMNETPCKHRLRAQLFDYIECFYNRQRLHSSLGYRSPSEVEEWYYTQTT